MSDDDVAEIYKRTLESTMIARLCNCPACIAREAPDPNNAVLLHATADAAIRATLADGNAKCRPGEWLEHGSDEHLYHAGGHLLECGRGKDTPMHVRHAITRLVMALAILERP